MTFEQQVRERLDQLTKPRGSLGRLEDAMAQLARIQKTADPTVDRKGIYVFCGNHGVTAEGVTPYPREVTSQMVANFRAGGAAINVLCATYGIDTVIVDAGISPGTRNFAHEPAMSAAEVDSALALGSSHAEEAAKRFDIVGLGEMGIGNTTSAAAILSAATGSDPLQTAGAGTGLDQAGIVHKASVIRRALLLHSPDANNGASILQAVGGFEIAAIAGFILRAYRLRLPVVADGFPCCAGALIAKLIEPDSVAELFFAHRSAERGHELMLRFLEADPWLDLGMRLGEGTGAAILIGILEAAVGLYRGMATFSEARVSMDSDE
jgi:nicotinate-nucleotide--dimethylbenzimidazole phosphoribosyltransferase